MLKTKKNIPEKKVKVSNNALIENASVEQTEPALNQEEMEEKLFPAVESEKVAEKKAPIAPQRAEANVLERSVPAPKIEVKQPENRQFAIKIFNPPQTKKTEVRTQEIVITPKLEFSACIAGIRYMFKKGVSVIVPAHVAEKVLRSKKATL